MPHGGDDGKGDGLLAERTAGGGPANPAAAPLSGVPGDRLSAPGRAAGEQPHDLFRHAGLECHILVSPSLPVPFAAALAATVVNSWRLGKPVVRTSVVRGPVVLTVAVVGYAAAGIWGGLIAVLVAFAPSFVFVLAGGPRFDQIRSNPSIQSFLTGAGPAVIGAIAGSAIPLGLAFQVEWQIPILAGALIWLFIVRRGIVGTLLLAAAIGLLLALAGVAV